MLRYPIIAVDFDRTIGCGQYPDIVLDPIAVKTLKKFRNKGGRLILWTCRYGEELAGAVRACRDSGLDFEAVNANDPTHLAEWSTRHDTTGMSPKIYADLYIDDHARLDGAVDWQRLDAEING